MLSTAAFPAAGPALPQGSPIRLCLQGLGVLHQEGLMLAVLRGRSFWVVLEGVKQAHQQDPGWRIMATGHVFAMSFNHISQGFVTAEVPTWEIHFPGMVPAKRRLSAGLLSGWFYSWFANGQRPDQHRSQCSSFPNHPTAPALLSLGAGYRQ